MSRTDNGRKITPVGTGKTGTRTGNGRRNGRRSGRGATRNRGGTISTAAAMTTGAATAAGITGSTADDSLVGHSGQSLKHLVRDEPVPFREPEPICLP